MFLIDKNYLTLEEMDSLNRIVTMYLEYAENQEKIHEDYEEIYRWKDRLRVWLFYGGVNMLEKAIPVATNAHQGQVDKACLYVRD